jgi:CheY-like chemotaxis protein
MYDKQKTILIIEDSATQALFLQSRLHREGALAVCAWDGQVGVNMAHQLRPDVIVLDIQLPQLSGLEVCRQIRQAPDTHGTPIIVFTSRDGNELVEECKRAGATDFIHKDDFAYAVLIEVLRQMGFIPQQRPENVA